MVTRDVNVGTLLPLFIFLTAQTVAAVWWASQMHTTVTNMERSFAQFQQNQQAEDLRQWGRINQAEGTAEQVRADLQAVRVEVSGLRRDVGALKAELTDTNQLLREMFFNEPDRRNQ